MSRPTQVSMQDIAKAAGVSQAVGEALYTFIQQEM